MHATAESPAVLEIGPFTELDGLQAVRVKKGDRLPANANGVIPEEVLKAGKRAALVGDQIRVTVPWEIQEAKGFKFKDTFKHKGIETNPWAAVWNVVMVIALGLSLGFMAEGFTDLLGIKLEKIHHFEGTEEKSMFDFPVAGIDAPIFLLVLVGFTVGIVGGFIGVGGGYMVTPALIVFGFPGYMASGIDMTHIAGKGVVSTDPAPAARQHRLDPGADHGGRHHARRGARRAAARLLQDARHLRASCCCITSVVVMFALFLYTQIETRRAHKKIEEMSRGGQGIGRELQTSSLPQFFQSIPLGPDRALPHGPGRRLDVGHRARRRRHRRPGRLPRRRRRLHPRAGAGLPRRRLDPHRGRHRSGRDRVLRRLRRPAPLDRGPRGHDGGAVHDLRRHDRRPVRQHRHRPTCAVRPSATS